MTVRALFSMGVNVLGGIYIPIFNGYIQRYTMHAQTSLVTFLADISEDDRQA